MWCQLATVQNKYFNSPKTPNERTAIRQQKFILTKIFHSLSTHDVLKSANDLLKCSALYRDKTAG